MKICSIFNAFTESLKDGNLAELPKRTGAPVAATAFSTHTTHPSNQTYDHDPKL